MNNSKRAAVFVVISVCLVTFAWGARPAFSAPKHNDNKDLKQSAPADIAPDTLDPFMGDWQVDYQPVDAPPRSYAGQVIPLGKGNYRLSLYDAFDQRL